MNILFDPMVHLVVTPLHSYEFDPHSGQILYNIMMCFFCCLIRVTQVCKLVSTELGQMHEMFYESIKKKEFIILLFPYSIIIDNK